MTESYRKYGNNVKNILISDERVGVYHKSNFDNYNYGDMTPINSQIINDIPGGKIVLTEEVYDALMAVCDVTSDTNNEFPFHLYGKDLGNNNIEFSEFFSSSKKREITSVSFDEHILDSTMNKINKHLHEKSVDDSTNKLVVAHGHSHPSIGSFYENFSLGDFCSYMYMNKENEIFNSRDVELVSCLVTPSRDVNFLFYDNQYEKFYRFINVVVRNKNNVEIPVDCYGIKHSNNRINGR